jgi:SpoVK/Ycf46/Vps4 family AAA+-type ATPase
MPTVAVDLASLAERTEGFSPADLKALAQEAALAAMSRTGGEKGEPASVTQEDFDEALGRLQRDARPEALV